MKRYYRLLFLGLSYLGISSSVYAHPHSFIDLHTTFIAGNDDIQGLSMRWTFDPMTSSSVLYDLKGKKNSDPEWQEQALFMINNIIENHYFSNIYRNNIKLLLENHVSNLQLSKQGLKIVLSFNVNFQHPQPIPDSHYQITTFEPTFFVDMMYANANDIILSSAMVEYHHCQLSLVTPEPSKELEEYALSLDKSDNPTEDIRLGAQFAQKIEITCP